MIIDKALRLTLFRVKREKGNENLKKVTSVEPKDTPMRVGGNAYVVSPHFLFSSLFKLQAQPFHNLKQQAAAFQMQLLHPPVSYREFLIKK